MEEFQNRPETREAEDAEQHRSIDALDEQRADAACNSQNEKNWPALHPKVVLTLDDDRVEDPDTKESPKPKYDAMKIHICYPFEKSAANVRNNTRTAKQNHLRKLEIGTKKLRFSGFAA